MFERASTETFRRAYIINFGGSSKSSIVLTLKRLEVHTKGCTNRQRKKVNDYFP